MSREPDNSEFNEGPSRVALLMRLIMSAGAGLMIKIGATSLICPLMNPINPDFCVILTGNIWKLLIDASMVPIAMGSLAGITVMLISGKWKNN